MGNYNLHGQYGNMGGRNQIAVECVGNGAGNYEASDEMSASSIRILREEAKKRLVLVFVSFNKF
jgi:hypothetical protein